MRTSNLLESALTFIQMNDSFEPVNVREGHPHVRGLINFLISLFRASALLIVLEYLQFGQVERHQRRVFQEFYRAEYEVAVYDETVWSLRKTELLGAMALLLGPQLFNDQEPEGTFEVYHDLCDLEIMEHRCWLSNLWLCHYSSESANFKRCQDCPCRSFSRVQRLWETGMTRDDYIQFLSENSWIWAIEPGWAMEERLKTNPDSFEMAQPPCLTCIRRSSLLN